MLYQIKKNNQKNVVIVPIHVHHHDSQVSQIFAPCIASDITQAQQKNFEGKNASNDLSFIRTWLDNESDLSIPNFNCIVKYKRPNTRAGGVAIYQNSSDAVNIITPSVDCSVSQSDIYGTIQTSVGDLYLAECVIDNGIKL
ncbi:hypothetical protein TNIN_495391 [Trichonephila inaurata madagascariensis]|uniref:Uncharacterized protein n=1 Tax=Trichonephila inaurata madagascariensis TaxID=2747483 RepID=A0A8X6X050_9ARAC|nr:hypothetical protein TNIN_495391 [Trichonephila inaurata madagascariensis]